MLLDLYQALMRVGFPLTDYHYVGFGSIFFIDFRILHKLMRINRMTSIEGFPSLWRRCEFNKPFDNVSLFKGLSTDFLPEIDSDEFYLAWFDYDFPVNRVVADDIAGLASSVRPWSMIFITVDLEAAEEMADELPATFFDYFNEELPSYAKAGLTPSDFSPDVRENTIIRMIERCFEQGIRGRRGITFEYLIRLTYADGHRMLTIGGMVADAPARSNLASHALSQLWFLSRHLQGTAVDIPKLVFTQKEILALEQRFPDADGPPRGIGVTKAEFEDLRKFYRYWPSYFESLS